MPGKTAAGIANGVTGRTTGSPAVSVTPGKVGNADVLAIINDFSASDVFNVGTSSGPAGTTSAPDGRASVACCDNDGDNVCIIFSGTRPGYSSLSLPCD